MFQTIFNMILMMSIVGTIIYMTAYLLRAITMKIFDSTWHLWMTCVTLLFFLLPISLLLDVLKMDVLSFFVSPGKVPSVIFKLGEGNYIESGMASLDVLLISNTQRADFIFYKALLEKSVVFIKYIWISGVLIFSMLNFKRYREFKKIIKRSRLIGDGFVHDVLSASKQEIGISRKITLLENKFLGTPILMGLFKPQIVLPKVEIEAFELEYVFSHECIHLKRGHLWIKALLILVGIIHWFNPLCLLLKRDVNRLCELSCDEELVEKIHYNERKKYAQTIISMLDKRIGMSGIVYSALNENTQNLKERLSKILEYRKPKKGMRFFSVFVALIIALLSVPVSSAVAYRSPEPVMDGRIQSSGDLSDALFDLEKLHPDGESAQAGFFMPTSPLKETEEMNFQWPLPRSNYVTSPFGTQHHPVTNEERFHSGVDVAAEKGADIVAAGSGEVIFSEWHDDYGYTIRIKHNDVYSTAYAHCSKLLVKAGDLVKAGQKIAEVGSTGKSTGPHLHFEITKDGELQDPLTYVNFQEHVN